MKKTILLCLGCSIISSMVVILFMGNSFFSDEKVIKDERIIKNFGNTISMMYETSASSGVYEEVSNTSWPESGYTFNSTLSKCENGSTLSWDESTKKVQMKGNVSDKCYVYFDKEVPKVLLADYIKNTVYTGTQGENNIYYHASSLTNGAGDDSYRYSGSYGSVNNYVCFGSDEVKCPHDNLYRIIGVFNNQVKLIKADYAKSSLLGTGGDYKSSFQVSQESNTSFDWGTSKGSNTKEEIGGYYWNYSNGNNSKSIWAESRLNTINLNQVYLNSLGELWQLKIADTSWKIGGNSNDYIMLTPKTVYQGEIINPVSGHPSVVSKIGLMYVSDYAFAATPSAWTTNLNSYSTNDIINNNWMHMGLYEWTITRMQDNYTNGNYAYSIGAKGFSSNLNVVYGFAVRPCFYLNSNIIKTSGAGTPSDPYRIQ